MNGAEVLHDPEGIIQRDLPHREPGSKRGAGEGVQAVGFGTQLVAAAQCQAWIDQEFNSAFQVGRLIESLGSLDAPLKPGCRMVP